MPFEAILFDMDGVITDTHQAVTEFWHRWAALHRLELSQSDFHQHIYGCPATYTLDVFFAHLAPAERQAIIADMVEYEINQTYTAVKGVIAFLEALSRLDFPTALVTSGEHWKVNAVLKQLKLEGMFKVIITVADIRQGKPHPDCYLLAASRLQKAPQQCLVFEDALSGVKAAVAAGTCCIGVQPHASDPLRQAGARYIIPDFRAVTLQAGANSANTLQLLLGSATSLVLQRSL